LWPEVHDKHGILAKSRHLMKIMVSVISVFPWFSTVLRYVISVIYLWVQVHRRHWMTRWKTYVTAQCQRRPSQVLPAQWRPRPYNIVPTWRCMCAGIAVWVSVPVSTPLLSGFVSSYFVCYKLSPIRDLWSLQRGHLHGKPGKIGEFDIGRGKVGEIRKSRGNCGISCDSYKINITRVLLNKVDMHCHKMGCK